MIKYDTYDICGYPCHGTAIDKDDAIDCICYSIRVHPADKIVTHKMGDVIHVYIDTINVDNHIGNVYLQPTNRQDVQIYDDKPMGRKEFYSMILKDSPERSEQELYNNYKEYLDWYNETDIIPARESV